MADHLTENARLRAALDLIVNDYGINHTSKFARDAARAALATPAPDTRKEVMPDDETTLSHARPDTSPGVTAGAPATDAVQEAARVLLSMMKPTDWYQASHAMSDAEGGVRSQDERRLSAALRAIAGDRT